MRKTRVPREARKDSSFRNFKQQVEAKRQKEVEWNRKMTVTLKDDYERKQEVALIQERQRLDMLEQLKMKEGPFTNAEEVEDYMKKNIPEKEKQARMKKEVQFARDSSTTLRRVYELFKIQVS